LKQDTLEPLNPGILRPIINEPIIVVEDLTMAFGENVIQKDLTFTINKGDVFIVWREWLRDEYFLKCYRTFLVAAQG
jgi:hypothetical protein